MAVKLGDLYSNLDLEYSGFLTGLKKSVDATASSSASINKDLSTIKVGLQGLFAGALVQQAGAAIGRALDYASSLDEVSQQLGVTARDLQVYRYAASQVGISQETMDKGLQNFTRSLGEARAGNAAAIGAFRELGLSLSEIKTGDPHDVLLKTADGLAQIKDRANRAAPEIAIFKRAGQDLDTLFSGGSAGIKAFAAAAADLGIVLSQDQIENADRTADKLSELKTVLEANVAGAVANNALAIYNFVSSLERLIGKAPTAINYLKQLQQQIALRQSQAGVITGELSGNLIGAANNRAAAAAAQGELNRLQNEGKPNPAQSSLDALDRFNPRGGKSYTNPATLAAAEAKAAALARKSEQLRQQGLRRDERYQSELERATDEELSLRGQLTADVRNQARYQHDQVDLAAKSRDNGYDLDVAEHQLTAGAAEALKLRGAINDDLKHGAINRELDAKLDQQELDAKLGGLENMRDLLSAQSGLARTAGERHDLELRLLDLQHQEEVARQQAIIASKASTDPEKALASARLAILPQLQALDRQQVDKRNAGPGAAYLDGLIQSAGEANEVLQSIEVEGLKGLNDGLADAITGSSSLGEAFHKVAEQIIGDLARIAVERAVIGPLANALFGAGSAGLTAGMGVSSSLLSAPSIAPAFSMPALKFASGGSFEVGGAGGPDSKLFSLALSPGEAVNVEKGGRRAQAGTVVHQTIQFSGAVDMADRAYVNQMADAAYRGAVRAVGEQNRRAG